MNSVSVVILNWNGEKFLRQFLPGVIDNTPHAQIVVADNGSTDGSLNLLDLEFPGVQKIILDNNYGFCGGYNRALQQIDSTYTVLLNSDVQVTSGWLEPLVSLLEKNPNIAAVQPKILSHAQPGYFEYAGAGGGFIDWLGYPFCRGRLFDDCEQDLGQYNDIRPVFWATGACMVVRTAIYKELGGLDEDFFAHMEEIDLCWRMQRAGYQIFYVGTSSVYHVGGGTLSKVNARKTFLNFRNGLATLLKNISMPSLLLVLPIRMFLDYVACIRFLFTGNRPHAIAIVRAHLDFIKNFSRHRKKRTEHSLGYPNVRVYPRSIVAAYYLWKKKKIVVD